MTFVYSEHPRFAQAWAEDKEVIERLRSSGDVPEIVREIDLSFRGELANLQRLAENCGDYGFSVVGLDEEDEDDGEPLLSLVRNQPTDDNSLRDLTMAYLLMEDAFDVILEGWGCFDESGEDLGMSEPAGRSSANNGSWLSKLFGKKN